MSDNFESQLRDILLKQLVRQQKSIRDIALQLQMNPGLIYHCLIGSGRLTLRRAINIATALDCEISFSLKLKD